MNIIEHIDKKENLRINKFLSESGYCSRREADRLVSSGQVIVNNQVASIGMVISINDDVVVNGKLIKPPTQHVYLALNKPVGIECITDRNISGNVIDFINYDKRIFPIGRLDKDSEGLLLLTSDGDIVNKITRSNNNHEKEYIVTVDSKITAEFINKMMNGVPILNKITKPCKVKKIDNFTFNIIITEGLNRQIRRMCKYFNYRVLNLKRIRIMNILLGDLKVGKYRLLNEKEQKELNELLKYSSKT